MSKFNTLILTKLFMTPEYITKDNDFLAEDFYNELLNATSYATKGRELTIVETDKLYALIEIKNVKNVDIAVFDILTKDNAMIRYQFWYNKTSIESLGEYLRTIPRKQMADYFGN